MKRNYEPNSEEREQWLHELEQYVGTSDKRWGIAFCLSLFLGYFGADRFYLGYLILGVLKLVSFGGFGVWYLIDLIMLLSGKMRDADGGVLCRPF